jgi:serine/threonine protein kinase
MCKSEIEMMQKIEHPNVVRVFRSVEGGVYTKKNGSVKTVSYILMEFCDGGEVFEFLYQTGKFPEPIARYYVLQLL